MVRFLHTADWQLGLKVRFVPGDAGARVRHERFEVVRRIAEVAKARAVDAVVVCGDVLDDNAVGRDTLQAATDALATFAPVPVLLLPGNHDAAEPGSALSRLAAGDHVTALLDRTPVAVGDAVYFPCPLMHRHERDDPTRDLPPRADGDGVRVALAHGGALGFGEDESTETPNRIDGFRVVGEKGFDYLALGDWHGTLGLGPRIWYPGAPEATRFKERDPGNVLLVEVDGPGATPRVETVPVARTRWLRHRETLNGPEDVDALAAWLAGLPERSMTLLELTCEGALSLGARARLDALLEREREALLYLQPILDALADAPSDADLEALAVEGFVGEAAAVLRGAHDDASRDALRLLFRYLTEADG